MLTPWSSAGFTPWAAWARAHGPPQEKRPLQRDKRRKKCMLQKVITFLLHLITCHNIFWPNRYTYFSQARIQRGGAGGARPSREKSAYTTTLLVFILGQFFGQIPQIFDVSSIIPINAHIHYWLLCTFYVTWAARASTSIIVPMGLHKGKSGTAFKADFILKQLNKVHCCCCYSNIEIILLARGFALQTPSRYGHTTL